MDGRSIQFSTKSTNKNVARTIEAKRRMELVKGRAGLTSPTLEAFVPRFINSLPGRVAKPTFSFYVCHVKTLLKFQPLADCPLDQIDPNIIETFVKWRRVQVGRGKAAVTAATINHALRTLRRLLGLAVEWNVIVKVPRVKLLPNEHQRDYVITDQDITNFAARPGLIGKMVPLLCDTGLRRLEAVNLTWAAVNFHERFIQVTKGKSKLARRKIPLTSRAEKILLELKAAPDAHSEYVFSIRGNRITTDWLSHAFMKARRRLKLPNDCVTHSTRHTFASRLGEAGCDAVQIQRLCGHSSLAISQKYIHPSVSRLDVAISLLEPVK